MSLAQVPDPLVQPGELLIANCASVISAGTEKMVIWDDLDLQAPNGNAFRIGGDARGMETVLMLARSTPLPASDDEVRGWFAGLEPLPLRGERARSWFENFDLREFDPTGTTRSVEAGDGPAAGTPRGLQAALKRKVGPVELSGAISFARLGPNE